MLLLDYWHVWILLLLVSSWEMNPRKQGVEEQLKWVAFHVYRVVSYLLLWRLEPLVVLDVVEINPLHLICKIRLAGILVSPKL